MADEKTEFTQPEWDEYCRRNGILFSVMFGSIVIWGGLYYLIERYQWPNDLNGASGIFGLICVVGAAIWRRDYPCPRCKKPFFVSMTPDPMKDNIGFCRHCGIEAIVPKQKKEQ